jgi:hypothetical protein
LEPPAAEDTLTEGDIASGLDTDTVVNRCMNKLIPTLEDSFRSLMDKFHNGNAEGNTTPVPPSATLPTDTAGPSQVISIPLLEDIASGTTPLDPITSPPIALRSSHQLWTIKLERKYTQGSMSSSPPFFQLDKAVRITLLNTLPLIKMDN